MWGHHGERGSACPLYPESGQRPALDGKDALRSENGQTGRCLGASANSSSPPALGSALASMKMTLAGAACCRKEGGELLRPASEIVTRI